MHKVAVIVGPGHTRSVISQRCAYQQIGKLCKFCAIQHWWDANIEEALPIYEKYGLKLYGGTGGRFTSLKGM